MRTLRKKGSSSIRKKLASIHHHHRPSSPSPASPPLLTYDELSITIDMLPSINEKFGHRHYVTNEYRVREQKAVDDLRAQLHAINAKRFNAGKPLWKPQETDRYLVTCCFEFTHELMIDLDNPFKPTCDALQKAGILYNDNRNVQLIVDRTSYVAYPYAHMIIRTFHKDAYRKVPLDALAEQWLLDQGYIAHRFGVD